MPTRRELALAGLLITGLVGVAFQQDLHQPLLTRWYSAAPTGPTVLFVVMDTTRADHLSACGYDRPTTPVLQALVDAGASLACDAVAPGSWTFPSHASYFTGQPVTAHGAHFVGGGTEIRQLSIRPLDDRFPTLADQLAASGHQTVALSANPVLDPASGLQRGFEDYRVAPQFGAWYGDRLVDQVRTSLRARSDDTRPLFLFVNIADAHDPWWGPPDGLDWVPGSDDFLLYFRTDPQTGEIIPGEWADVVTGALTDAEHAAFQRRVTDLYDYALFKADRTLGAVIEAVRAHGWADHGLRIVIVADHGEFLGEHDLARHGRYLWQPNNGVALMVADTAGPPPLPPRPSAMESYDLVLTGQPASPAHPPQAVAFPDNTWYRVSDGAVGGETSAAIWSTDDKLLWVDGRIERYDLVADPAEQTPLPVPGTHPGIPALMQLVEQTRTAAARDLETDPALIEALKAAGYIDNGQ